MSTFKAELKGVIALVAAAVVVVFLLLSVTGVIDIGIPGLSGPKPAVGKIAFISDRGGQTDLWVMNADGSGLLQLTDDSFVEGHPTWDFRGTRLLYVSNKTGAPQIFGISPYGGPSHQVTVTTGAKTSLSMNRNGALAFVSQGTVFLAQRGQTELLLPTPAQRTQQLKQSSALGYENLWPYRQAMLCPIATVLAAVIERSDDGRQFAQYLSKPGAEPRNIKAADGRPLSGGAVSIAWQKHGRRLAIAVSDGPMAGLFLTGPSPTVARRALWVNREKVYPSEPEWSPDGLRIAFVGLDGRGERLGLYVLGTKGDFTKFVGGDVRSPRWSPDGKLILYQSGRAGRADLWTVEVSTKRTRNLTAGNGNNKQGEWSPAVSLPR